VRHVGRVLYEGGIKVLSAAFLTLLLIGTNMNYPSSLAEPVVMTPVELASYPGLEEKLPGNMNATEARWCANVTRVKICNSAYRDLAQWAISHAEKCSVEATICKSGDEANAFQHCMWSATLKLYHGEKTARGFLERHEANSNGDPDSQRDWVNNETGFRVATEAATDMYIRPSTSKKEAVFERCIELVRSDSLDFTT
jgi:hypothetical protein